MKAKDYNQLMQLVDALDHEECSKHEDCEDETNPCIFYRNKTCIPFYFSVLLDELKHKSEASNDEAKNQDVN